MNRRIYQDCEFEFELLNGLAIEKLVVCEEIETQNIITVHLKIEKGKWYQYFLDAGMGFFETWNEFDEIENDETYRYVR